MEFSRIQTITLITIGNLPLRADSIVEGGGLRVWGLANALQQAGFSVQILVPSIYVNSQKEVSLNLIVNPYSDLTDLVSKSADADAVIYPAGAIHVSESILRNANSHQLLIADAYVPMHLEVSARQFVNVIEREQDSFAVNSIDWLRAVERADLILCASDQQKIYYLGLLCGSANLTPKTYNSYQIITVPFGLEMQHELPKDESTVDQRPPTFLWYGGFYPWFDSTSLGSAISQLNKQYSNSSTFRVNVVGSTNPFIRGSNFIQEAKARENELLLLPNVELIKWSPYSRRSKNFSNIDGVICMNKPGFENLVAWRTRYLDFIQFGVPLLSNGQDPLAEEILSSNAGLRIANADALSLKTTLESIIENPMLLRDKRNNYSLLQQKYVWKETIRELVSFLLSPPNRAYKPKIVSSSTDFTARNVSRKKLLIQLAKTNFKAEGFNSTLKKSFKYIFLSRKKYEKSSVKTYGTIIAGQMNRSGAPLLAKRMSLEIWKGDLFNQVDDVRIMSFGRVDLELARELKIQGVEIISQRNIRDYNFLVEDQLIINGLGSPQFFFDWMIRNQKKFKAIPILLVHEDRPLMHLTEETLYEIGEMARNQRIKVIVPSWGTFVNISKYIDRNCMAIRQYPVKDYGLQKSSYDELNIHLTGSTYDYRKSHLEAIEIFTLVMSRCKNNLEKYRKFKLVLIGVNPKTKPGKEIASASKVLGNQVEIYPELDEPALIQVLKKCNVVLCLSEYESLPLFVSESMTLGHLVFRNSSSGSHEQLHDGINGISVDYDSLEHTVDQIVQILDKQITPASKLENMSNASRSLIETNIAATFTSYLF